MSFTRTQVIIVFILAFVGIAVLLIFLGVIPGLQHDPTNIYKADISVWLFGADESAYGGAMQKYKLGYPGVTVNYRVFNDAEEYEEALLDALAAGQGPDIFSIPNNSFYKYENKIAPLSSKQFSALQLRQYFPQVLEKEFISSQGIYGLPLAMDSLALLYNRDFLDQEGIVAPPATWDEFRAAAKKLTKRDADGRIVRAGAAIGGSSRSVLHAPDILSLLMIQNGVAMTDYRLEQAIFAQKKGFDVFSFYTSFAKEDSAYQVWDESLPRSLESFAGERAAMIFAYQSDIKDILKRNSYLNFGVAPMPQLTGAEKVVTYPRYRAFTVSKQSKAQTAAWSFVITLTLYPESVFPYLNATKEPPALRPILARFAEDPILSVYARQALTAQSWSQIDPYGVRTAFDQAISEVVQKDEDAVTALSRAQGTISRQMQRRSGF